MIFRLPFFNIIRAVIHISQGIIGTRFGVLKILYGFSVTQANTRKSKINDNGFFGVIVVNKDKCNKEGESLIKIIEGIVTTSELKKDGKNKLGQLLL